MNIADNDTNFVKMIGNVQGAIVLNGHRFELMLAPEQIAQRVKELAGTIRNQLRPDTSLEVVVLMNGAFVFAADLCRQLHQPLAIKFLRIQSYKGTQTSGEAAVLSNELNELRRKQVLLVEDIADTGTTLATAVELINSYQPAGLQIVTLLHKPAVFKKNIRLDYVGFEIPDTFVVGYGLDLDGMGRNLGGIYTLIS